MGFHEKQRFFPHVRGPSLGLWDGVVWINLSDLQPGFCSHLFPSCLKAWTGENKRSRALLSVFWGLSHRENNQFEFYAMTSSATNQHREGGTGFCLWNQPLQLSNCKRQWQMWGRVFFYPVFMLNHRRKWEGRSNMEKRKPNNSLRVRNRPSRSLHLCPCLPATSHSCQGWQQKPLFCGARNGTFLVLPVKLFYVSWACVCARMQMRVQTGFQSSKRSGG